VLVIIFSAIRKEFISRIQDKQGEALLQKFIWAWIDFAVSNRLIGAIKALKTEDLRVSKSNNGYWCIAPLAPMAAVCFWFISNVVVDNVPVVSQLIVVEVALGFTEIEIAIHIWTTLSCIVYLHFVSNYVAQIIQVWKHMMGWFISGI
jgi:hypothetical protein